jgi:hypothetical protein
MFWDGDTLTIVGAIRQVTPGVSEGSLRGAWTSGYTYYANDIVSYAGQSWQCTSATSHVATNNTNATTGYPGSGPWVIAAAAGTSGTAGSGGTAGTAGATGLQGAGVVYRGEFAAGTAYVKSDIRRDVIQGSDGQYYLCKLSYTPADNSTRPIDGTYSTYWETFGATFSSVATDVLFANDIYSKRTINIGSTGATPVIALNAGYPSFANPFISIGQGTQGYGINGIFMGYSSATPKLSLQKSLTEFLKYDTNVGLQLSGEVTATSGKIGDWDILSTGILQASSSAGQISLNPNVPSIKFKNSAGAEKLILQNGVVPDPSGTALTLNITIPTVTIPSSGFQTADYRTSVSSTPVNIVIGGSDVGDYSAITNFSAFTGVAATWNSNFAGNGYIQLYAVIRNPAGQVVSYLTIASSNFYADGMSGGSSEVFYPANYTQYISFPIAGTYTISTEAEVYYNVYAGTVSNSTITSPSTYASSALTFTQPLSLSLITDEGLLMAFNPTRYLKINRNSGDMLKILGNVDFGGGTVSANGYTKLTNGIILQWGYQTYTGIATPVVFPIVFPTACTSVHVTTNRVNSGANGYNHAGNLTTSGFSAVFDAVGGWWSAIGY